jgi:phosphate acetyltransferase
MDLMDILKNRAKQNKKTIVLPEGDEDRTLQAASIVLSEDIASLILVGDKKSIINKSSNLKVDVSKALIINPNEFDKIDFYANQLFELRKHKRMTEKEASKLIIDNLYFATMMVKLGDADGMVSGAEHTTAEVLKPALQLIKAAPNEPIVSSFYVIKVPNCDYGDKGLFLFADCGLNENPTAQELAAIATQTAKSAKILFNMDPKVALLSFSTKGSAYHESIVKIREALDIVKSNNKELAIDGELQLDAAIVPEVASLKAPDSVVAGRANILIFPDLQSGNIGYKLVERFAGAMAIGPLCQGIAKPVNDLSRGCSVDDIVKAVIITSIQAEEQE